MAIDVSKIKDPGLAAAVLELGCSVEHKANKPKWQAPTQHSRDRNAWLLENGKPEQAQESAELARKRYGD